MKTGIVIAMMCLAGILVVSPGAAAYDDLITNDTANVNSPGGLVLGVSLFYTTAGDRFDADGDAEDTGGDVTRTRIPLKVSYGFGERFTALAVLPVVAEDNRDDRKTGLGDIWLAAKYRILSENRLTLRGALLMAGDRDDRKGPGSDGGPGFDFAVMTMHRFGEFGLSAQTGVRWNNEDADKFAPGASFYADAEGSVPLAGALRGLAGLEFKTVGDGEIDGVAAQTASRYLDLNIGAGYALTSATALRGDFIYTLAGKSEYRNIGILIGLVQTIR